MIHVLKQPSPQKLCVPKASPLARGGLLRCVRHAESASRERLGDFYLDPLPERTTIANARTKHVSFIDVGGTPAARAYEHYNGWLPRDLRYRVPT